MEIRKTKKEELHIVLAIYERARNFMAENGNPNQWGKKSPSDEQVEADIRAGRSYVCVEGDKIAGVFYYAFENDPTYDVIKDGSWLSDKPYGVIHRIARAGKKKGVLKTCIEFCLKKTNHIRIDTHENNTVMHHLLSKYGFSKRGIIFLQNGDERIAYEYIK